MKTVKDNNLYKAVQGDTSTLQIMDGTRIGSVNISSDFIASNFTTSNYIDINGYNFSASNTWELVAKIKGYNTSRSFNPIFAINDNRQYSSFFAINSSGKAVLRLTNSTSSYNICNITSSDSIPMDSWIYIAAVFTGTSYRITYSTTGTGNPADWTSLASVNSSTKYTSDLKRLGQMYDSGTASSRQGFGGEIDLKGCWMKKNGGYRWQGVTSITQQSYGCWGNAPETIFESSTGGTYSVNIPTQGRYEITCVGGGGAAAMRGVYDDKGYGWGGGSGGAFKGIFELNAGSYTVVVGSANNNTTAQSGNTQTLNPTDTTTHDSYVQGVVTCGGGGSGHYNTSYVGEAGAAPVFSIMPESTTINSAGNAGFYNSGGKGSAAAAVCAGGASVYLDYGRGQGCRTSEYASKRSWINGTNGYVRIRRMY